MIQCASCFREISNREFEELIKEDLFECPECKMNELRTDSFTTDRGRSWFRMNMDSFSIVHENIKETIRFTHHKNGCDFEEFELRTLAHPFGGDAVHLSEFLRAVEQLRFVYASMFVEEQMYPALQPNTKTQNPHPQQDMEMLTDSTIKFIAIYKKPIESMQ